MKTRFLTIIMVLFAPVLSAQVWNGTALELIHNTLGSNGDYTAFYRADTQTDRTHVRLRMGDEYTSDFEIGYTNWQDGQWVTNFSVDGWGNSTLRNKLGISNVSPEAYLHIGSSNLGWTRSVRMILEPPQHTGAGWEFSVRDDPSKSFLGMGYGTEQFVMDHNGNVGIAGSIQGNNMGRFKGWAAGGETGLGFEIGISSQEGYAYVYDRTAGAYGTMHIQNVIHTSGNNGNVGIGTTTPDAKLAVKGTVHAQEVKVDLNGAVAPDYVFEADYKLLSLEEIKTYIARHKHLPEIPSAKEMEANGVNLGEMNLLLLKKIEELTLHLLKQQEQLSKQQAEINLLKSKN